MVGTMESTVAVSSVNFSSILPTEVSSVIPSPILSSRAVPENRKVLSLRPVGKRSGYKYSYDAGGLGFHSRTG